MTKLVYATAISFCVAIYSFVPAKLSHAKEGFTILDCSKRYQFGEEVTDPEWFTHLECNADSMEGIERFTQLNELTLIRKPKSVYVDPNIRMPKVVALKLWFNSDWSSEEEIIKFARLFPNIQYIECKGCNLLKLGYLSHFKNMTSLLIEGPGLSRKLGKGPPQEYDLTGLNYETLEIRINPGLDMNIKCKALGIWSHKIREPRRLENKPEGVWPYRSLHSCYPELLSLSKIIIDGDQLYNKGKLEEAHQRFLKGFHINPYDQQIISRLSLTFYKKQAYCKAAQVAYSGTELINGTDNTRAAIWYNYYLSMNKLGLKNKAKTALVKSNNFKPSKHKQKLLTEASGQAVEREKLSSTNCSFSNNWIDALHAQIEKNAIQFSRSGIVDDYCVKKPHFVSCRRGKLGPCFRTLEDPTRCQ